MLALQKLQQFFFESIKFYRFLKLDEYLDIKIYYIYIDGSKLISNIHNIYNQSIIVKQLINLSYSIDYIFEPIFVSLRSQYQYIYIYYIQMKSKSVILKSRDLKNLNGLFSVQQRNIEIQNGYILVVKVLAFSIDPVMTVWLSGAQTYFSKTQIGDIFFCFGIGEVIKSNNQNYQVGSLVFGNLGCTEISIIKNQNFLKTLFKIPKQLLQGFTPAEFVYLINNGLAAYGGISLMNLKKQQTVVVSTAAGATGILAIQILKNRGNKVIALTSKNKISSIQNKCDIAVDYKDLKKLNQVLKTNRFEHYFDNVGEWLLDLIIRYISPRGTISLCGATSNYLNFKERDGLKNYSAIISKSLKLNGFNFNMFMSQIFNIFQLYRNLKLKNKIQFVIQEIPIRSFPEYYAKLMKGDTVGKIIVTVQHSNKPSL